MPIRLLLFSLIIFTCKPFGLEQTNESPLLSNYFPHLNYPSNCSQSTIAMINKSILACQKSDIDQSAVCLRDYIEQNFLDELWNVLIKNVDSNVDTVAFWYLSSCVITRSNFGMLKRSYILWQYLKSPDSKTVSMGSLNEQKMTQNRENYLTKSTIREIKSLQKTGNIKLSANCPSWKESEVKNLLKFCDIPGNDRAARCIMDRIRNQIGEFWDVYINTSRNSSFASYFYQCIVTIQEYGTYSRYINAWRTRTR